MRIDVVTTFPLYLQPLKLSLVGKAVEDGLLTVDIHDLRDFTADRHRSVDDTPYGGGPGMVMTPEPWASALDHVHTLFGGGAQDAPPLLVVPSPAGQPMSQGLARNWAKHSRLVFACGRYEGIDQRVIDYAGRAFDVVEVSLGDFVVFGGEVAALAFIEAVAREIPGIIGNRESLVDESHAAGLLEAPSFTKPPLWREMAVPDVLLSGDHQAIARWRRDESLRRTAAVRPDLIAALDASGCSERDLEVLSDLGWHLDDGRFSRSDPPVAD